MACSCCCCCCRRRLPAYGPPWPQYWGEPRLVLQPPRTAPCTNTSTAFPVYEWDDKPYTGEGHA